MKASHLNSYAPMTLFYITLFACSSLAVELTRRALHIAPQSTEALFFIIMGLLVPAVAGLVYAKRSAAPLPMATTFISTAIGSIALQINSGAVAAPYLIALALAVAYIGSRSTLQSVKASGRKKVTTTAIVALCCIVFIISLTYVVTILNRTLG